MEEDDAAALRVLNRIIQRHVLERRDPWAVCSCGWQGEDVNEPVWWTDHLAHELLNGLRDADLDIVGRR